MFEPLSFLKIFGLIFLSSGSSSSLKRWFNRSASADFMNWIMMRLMSFIAFGESASCFILLPMDVLRLNRSVCRKAATKMPTRACIAAPSDDEGSAYTSKRNSMRRLSKQRNTDRVTAPRIMRRSGSSAKS